MSTPKTTKPTITEHTVVRVMTSNDLWTIMVAAHCSPDACQVTRAPRGGGQREIVIEDLSTDEAMALGEGLIRWAKRTSGD